MAAASTTQGDQNINPPTKTLAIGMRDVWTPIDTACCWMVMRTVSSTVQTIATPDAISRCEPRRADEAAPGMPDAPTLFTVAMCFQLNDRSRQLHFLRVSDQILRVAPDALRGSQHRHTVGSARRPLSAAYGLPISQERFRV